MSRYYLDASALVKRYVNEEGSDWLMKGMPSNYCARTEAKLKGKAGPARHFPR